MNDSSRVKGTLKQLLTNASKLGPEELDALWEDLDPNTKAGLAQRMPYLFGAEPSYVEEAEPSYAVAAPQPVRDDWAGRRGRLLDIDTLAAEHRARIDLKRDEVRRLPNPNAWNGVLHDWERGFAVLDLARAIPVPAVDIRFGCQPGRRLQIAMFGLRDHPIQFRRWVFETSDPLEIARLDYWMEHENNSSGFVSAIGDREPLVDPDFVGELIGFLDQPTRDLLMRQGRAVTAARARP